MPASLPRADLPPSRTAFHDREGWWSLERSGPSGSRSDGGPTARVSGMRESHPSQELRRVATTTEDHCRNVPRMAAGRHRRRLSRWTRVRQALAGAFRMPMSRGRHRGNRALAAEVARLTSEVAELRATAARLRSEAAVAGSEVATARLGM